MMVQISDKPKLPAMAHVLCGWPLILIAFGGAIGGGLGGAAYAINVALYRSELPVLVKIPLNLLTGASAIGLWIFFGVTFFNRK